MDSDILHTDRSGQPKGDKRIRTRAALLAAARLVVREKGYERTTLRDVAQRADMTIGAIYGNFKNRDELFMALADTYWAPITPRFEIGSTFAEKMRALAQATIAAIPERREAAIGRLTGMAYALTNTEMLRRIHDVTEQSYALGAEWLNEVADKAETTLPPETLVRVLHALTEGLLFQRFLTPDLLPDDVFYAAFAALAVKPMDR
jgi:AcrR family transcriptional regulator